MPFPIRKEVNKALKDLKKVDGTLALPKNPTALQRLRWEISQRFIKYIQENNLTQRQLADLLGIDEAKVSKILHHRLEGFSTDRLINLYEKLHPKVKLRVS